MNDLAFVHVIHQLGLHSIRPENAVRKLKGQKTSLRRKLGRRFLLRSCRTLIRSTKQREVGVDQEMGGANSRYEMEMSHGTGCYHDAQTIRL
jgi:hypothetical protein